jgi:hypothetical protein
MEQTMTISHLDTATITWIEQEALRTGTSIETIIRKLIYRGLERERHAHLQQCYHDLDSLTGTWSDKEASEFLTVLDDFQQVDQTLWR